jgi:PAS domain S-box-containing protein
MKKLGVSFILLLGLISIFLFGVVFNTQNFEELKLVSIILLALLLVLFGFVLNQLKMLKKYSNELERFRLIVEHSDNIVMVTDINQNITFVNGAFVEITGYAKDDVIGKNPKVIQSGQNSKSFYKNLNDVIYSKEQWRGTFINKTKDGAMQYEKATIIPVLDDEGDIIEFIGLKYDITSELDAQHQIREKEKKIFNQAKMASMGELLHNIAHHWRQPLSLISTVATSIELQQEMNMLTGDKLAKGMDDINKSVQNLSTIIEDFANFFQKNKPKEYCSIKNVITRCVNIVSIDFVNNKIIFDIDEISSASLYCYDSELIQAILNILTNSKDALQNKDEKIIRIRTKENKYTIELTIEDSGGGISDEIMKNIFEPYFTTKHKSQGTGMGLYNSYNIVVNRLDGELSASNSEFEHNGKKYFGAKLTIIIPKNSTITEN